MIATAANVEVFSLDEAMLSEAISLELTHALDLKPFDESILAAVLVRGRGLRDAGERDVCFVELDGDLQPWDRGDSPLQRLYDEAHIWVYRDYAQTTPNRPAAWPAR